MTIPNFPSELPPPPQLNRMIPYVVDLLKDAARKQLSAADDLMKARNSADFAPVIRRVATEVALVSNGLTAISAAVRKQYGI